MSEGDYVRTKDGIIDQVIIEYNGYCASPSCNCKHVSCRRNYYDEDKIIKSSPNIIDLIEVGDYVNGKKVVDKQYHYTDKDNYDMGEWCIFYENVALGDYQYDIKSIVTKEQFSCMEYKIGE